MGRSFIESDIFDNIAPFELGTVQCCHKFGCAASPGFISVANSRSGRNHKKQWNITWISRRSCHVTGGGRRGWITRGRTSTVAIASENVNHRFFPCHRNWDITCQARNEQEHVNNGLSTQRRPSEASLNLVDGLVDIH